MKSWMGFVVLVLCVAFTGQAWGNMRAPQTKPGEASAALENPEEKLDVEVLGETLVIHCVSRNECRVQAEYRISSAAEVTASLSFVMMGLTVPALEVSTNGQAQKVQVVPGEPGDDEESLVNIFVPYSSWENTDMKMYDVGFEAKLKRGENTLVVSYKQTTSEREENQSYLFDSTWAQAITYAMEPLRGWSLHQDFSLDLTVKMDREEAPGWWARNFGSYREMVCTEIGAAPRKNLASTQKGGAQIFHQVYDASFPGYLDCVMRDR